LGLVVHGQGYERGWGSSAGGHLAALVATSGDNPALEGSTGGNPGFSSKVLAAAAFYPPTDILKMQLQHAVSPVFDQPRSQHFAGVQTA
jgi:hypothetical protein